MNCNRGNKNVTDGSVSHQHSSHIKREVSKRQSHAAYPHLCPGEKYCLRTIPKCGDLQEVQNVTITEVECASGVTELNISVDLATAGPKSTALDAACQVHRAQHGGIYQHNNNGLSDATGKSNCIDGKSLSVLSIHPGRDGRLGALVEYNSCPPVFWYSELVAEDCCGCSCDGGVGFKGSQSACCDCTCTCPCDSSNDDDSPNGD